MSTATGRVLLDAEQLGRTLARIGYEIVEKQPALDQLCLVGIYTRGVPLAQRLRRAHRRDDRRRRAGRRARHRLLPRRRGGARRGVPAHAQPVVNATKLDFPIEGRTVVLVDDVLFTGRTIRAAIDAIFDYGRPARVQLAVLADRGHRELPIRADYVGKNLPTARTERVDGAAAGDRRGGRGRAGQRSSTRGGRTAEQAPPDRRRRPASARTSSASSTPRAGSRACSRAR